MNFNNQVAAVGIPVDATDDKVNEANIVSSYPARPAPIMAIFFFMRIKLKLV